MRAIFQLICLSLLTILSAAAKPIPQHALFTHLRAFEGYSLTPYTDRDGSMCVGIGHNLTAHHEPIKRLYTDAEVCALFVKDLRAALDTCRVGVADFDELPENTQMIAVGLFWTVGRTGFMRFTRFREALSAQDYAIAAEELRRSKWFGQVSSQRSLEYIRALWAHAYSPVKLAGVFIP